MRARWWVAPCLAAALVVLLAACSAAVAVRAPRTDAPILVLVSLDGWRWDYTDRAAAPNLRAIARRGVRADGLVPAFPSKTFPNHHTIVTGLYPEHHGIIANNMRDGAIGERFALSAPTARDSRWWGGEPLWVTAVRQGRRAASMFWPGSDVEIGGVRPDEWRPYDGTVPNEARVAQVIEWLARPPDARPSFITLYFSDVDSAGHTYGPEADETLAAAAELDRQIGDLMAGIERLGLTDGVDLVLVSDHGMAQLSIDRKVFIDDYLDVSAVDVIDWSPVLQVAPGAMSADEIYRALRGRHPALAVYRREDLPTRLRYSKHPRIPPVLALADEGWSITTRARFEPTKDERRHRGGEHGYDGRYRSMHGLFVAAGPSFRRGLVVPAFESVHLYELMCRVLGLAPAPNDGDAAATRGLLSPPRPPAPAAAPRRR